MLIELYYTIKSKEILKTLSREKLEPINISDSYFLIKEYLYLNSLKLGLLA